MMDENANGIVTLDPAWNHMKAGEYEQAYHLYTERLEKDPNSYERRNRGSALLLLGRYEEAFEDYRHLMKTVTDMEAHPMSMGIALWFMGRYDEAIQLWIDTREANLTYTDLAGSVVLSSIIYFAGVRQGDAKVEKRGLSYLRKRWKARYVHYTWPGPIAGYLLGHLSEKELYGDYKNSHAYLEKRRLCQVDFWVGVNALKGGDTSRWREMIERSVASRMILEDEFYLALAEKRRTEVDGKEK